jgi:hypothetical protein
MARHASQFPQNIKIKCLKNVSVLQLYAYQHCDHLLSQLCPEASLFVVSSHAHLSCIQLTMRMQIQNRTLRHDVEVILEEKYLMN